MRSFLPFRLIKRIALGCTILLFAASFITPMPPLSKGAPMPVQLSITANFINLPNDDNSIGTFTSSGFLNTNGTTKETVRITSNTFHAQTVFTNNEGSFTAKINGQYVFTGEATVEGSGNWVIVNGTGAYKKLNGTGSMTFAADFVAGTINDEWVGNMHSN